MNKAQANHLRFLVRKQQEANKAVNKYMDKVLLGKIVRWRDRGRYAKITNASAGIHGRKLEIDVFVETFRKDGKGFTQKPVNGRRSFVPLECFDFVKEKK